MDILSESEAVLVKHVLEKEKDDLIRVVIYFEREGMSVMRALEMAQEVLRVSRECGVGLYKGD